MNESGTDWATLIPLLTTGVVAILGALFAGLALLKAREVDATTKKTEVMVNSKSDAAEKRINDQEDKIARLELTIVTKDAAALAKAEQREAPPNIVPVAIVRMPPDAHPPQQESTT